jgi:hypothetical protein
MFNYSQPMINPVIMIPNGKATLFPKPGVKPAYLNQMTAPLRHHPNTTIIWAHTRAGRLVRPIQEHAAHLAQLLQDLRITRWELGGAKVQQD